LTHIGIADDRNVICNNFTLITDQEVKILRSKMDIEFWDFLAIKEVLRDEFLFLLDTGLLFGFKETTGILLEACIKRASGSRHILRALWTKLGKLSENFDEKISKPSRNVDFLYSSDKTVKTLKVPKNFDELFDYCPEWFEGFETLLFDRKITLILDNKNGDGSNKTIIRKEVSQFWQGFFYELFEKRKISEYSIEGEANIRNYYMGINFVRNRSAALLLSEELKKQDPICRSAFNIDDLLEYKDEFLRSELKKLRNEESFISAMMTILKDALCSNRMKERLNIKNIRVSPEEFILGAKRKAKVLKVKNNKKKKFNPQAKIADKVKYLSPSAPWQLQGLLPSEAAELRRIYFDSWTVAENAKISYLVATKKESGLINDVDWLVITNFLRIDFKKIELFKWEIKNSVMKLISSRVKNANIKEGEKSADKAKKYVEMVIEKVIKVPEEILPELIIHSRLVKHAPKVNMHPTVKNYIDSISENRDIELYSKTEFLESFYRTLVRFESLPTH
jgi:hypothetical protein